MDEVKSAITKVLNRIKGMFVSRLETSEKPEINWNAIKALSISFVVIFVAVVLLLPNESPIEFSEKLEASKVDLNADEARPSSVASQNERDDIWAQPKVARSVSGGNEVNYNTSMILGPKGKNAKTQIRPGQRLPLRILDKFVVSDSPVPVLADLLFAVETESGLRLPAGTRFYGEASFQKGQDRAQIRFTQISLPSGQIRQIAGQAFGKDGQPGVPGKVHSDGTKNTAGQIVTTFISGLAGGSVETDMFGNSRGGIQNGLMSAVAFTAKDRAQNYGEKLKAEREWVEVVAGAECDGSFDQSLELQMGAENE